ncbi:MAG: M20 family metallopeptidase [Actinomycetota bacterium]|nr:M20 family metallopeptidase [Actinomycetota bacterium]
MDLKSSVAERIDQESKTLIRISHEMYDHPELAFEEFRASDLLATALEDGGIKVERKAYGLDTAFRAVTGVPLGQGLHFIVCAEFDALPDIGHACGHNIIGTSAVGAGLGLAGVAEDLGITITVLGTPAEESGGGKIELLEAGAFEGADAAIMVHPAPMDVVDWPTLAWTQVEVSFHGKESHASAFPEQGLNALDAMTISYTAVGALRQHISPTERIHGIITHGGDAPNIVPKLTKARYFLRARTADELAPLKQRVIRCFEGGALAAGCEVEMDWFGKDYDQVVTNHTIGGFYESNLAPLGRTAIPRSMVEKFAGSTDMGNVSKALPSIHPVMGIDSLPAVNHQADFAAATITAAGDRAIMDAAKAMAWTLIDLATTDGAMDEVRERFANPPADTTLRI